MKLECIIFSFDYSDYLSITIPNNKHLFDNFVVITSPEDVETQKLCEFHSVECVITDSFRKNGSIMNRGRCFNEYYPKLKFNDWVLHIDSDIILPSNFRELFLSIHPDQDFFYGARRALVETYADLCKLKDGRKKISEFETPKGYGFGFFQLFNINSRVAKNNCICNLYPEGYNTIDTDWQFRNKWGDLINNYETPVGNLKELPLQIIHLGHHGKNHFGRVTKSFFEEK